jgi:hypothetical protein
MKENEENDGPRYPVMVAVKVSRALNEKIQRKAKEDDRPVSAFLRRTLSKALDEQEPSR